LERIYNHGKQLSPRLKLIVTEKRVEKDTITENLEESEKLDEHIVTQKLKTAKIPSIDDPKQDI
jgi:hypothetical protein